MKRKDFEKLITSVKQAGAIQRGLQPPSGVTAIDAADLAAFRDRADEPTIPFEDVVRDLERRESPSNE